MSDQERVAVYRIVGRVVDRQTRQGVSGLRVEAWDKDLIFDDLVGTTATDSEGWFSLSFDETYFRELFVDRRPDLFFRVYGGGERIASTENSVLWNVRVGATEAVIEVDLPPGGGDADAGTPALFLRLSGRVVAEGSEQPLAGYRVQGLLAVGDSEEPTVDLGYDLTDAEGRFSLPVSRGTVSTSSRLARAEDGGPLRLRLRIWDPGGDQIHEHDVQLDPQEPEIGSIAVPVPEPPPPDATPIQELVTQDRPVPPEVVSALAEHGIRTLADVRRTGGLSRLPDLPVPAEHPARAELEAQASLNLLSPDLQTTSRLIDGGFTSISAVASTPRSRFVEDVGEMIGGEQAQQIHAGAVAGVTYLDGVIVNRRVTLTGDGIAPFEIPALDELLTPACRCRDCEAAVSPAAYLADLVDYIRQLVQENGVAVDLQALTQRFYQPFGQLPAECGAVEARVRQVRICIEVLRRYLQDYPPAVDRQAALDVAEREYRRALYLRLLNEIGTSLEELAEARAAGQAAQDPVEQARRQAALERLAERVGVPVNRVLNFFLDPTAAPDPLTEAALENLFGLVSTDVGRDPLAPPQPSRLEVWRLERLRSFWYSQDWPDDQLPDGRPVIDPDVIGPDDFRAPIPRASVNDPEQAFDLWLRRRSWMDDRLAALLDPAQAPVRTVRGAQVPDYFTGMFAAMYAAVPGLQNPPWQNTQPADFPMLASRLTSGTRAQVEQARETLSTDLAIGPEAFTRLLELQAKDRRWVEHPTNPPVSDAEWREVAYILVQAMKRRSYPLWLQEEAQAQQPGPAGGEPALEFGPRDFWFPEAEPLEGEWPPVESRPFVDPERVERRQLPEWVAGGRALALWEQRRDELEQMRQRLRALREAQGLQAALGRALGDPNDPTNPAALPHDLDDLLSRLNALDPAAAETARTQVEQDLHMTVEAFRDLMEIRVRERAAAQPGLANPPAPPTESEWEEVYAVLTTAEKVERRYTDWAVEEQNPPAGPLPYWLALKARLPRWRADSRVRSEWQQALRIRSGPPIVDPDVVERGDLVQPWPGRPVYNLWSSRLQTLDTLQADLRQTRIGAADARAGLDAVCQRTLGHDSQALLDLDAAERDGYDIRPRFAQLSLTRREFVHLLRLRRLAGVGGPILDSAWSEGEADLTRVAKRRRIASWRAAERNAAITLRPDLFRLTMEDASRPTELPPGSRREPAARRVWRSLLSIRIDQRQALVDGIASMVSRVEEAVLPRLRDALIDASDPPGATGTNREAKGKRLTDLLLIETRDSGCALTPRISQAVSTLQGFVWSVRTGQLQDTYPGLLLLDDHFDERWTWLGSYASWRAALFVHLYPENLLVPSLRRERSWGFRQLLEEVRQRRRQIDPVEACRIARGYANYYRDIVSLTVEASCHAQTNLSGAPCQSRTFGGVRTLKYWFGRGPSGRSYWSRYDPDDPTSQSPWEPIPGLESVSALLGAVPFRARDLQDSILVFAATRKEGADQLLLARYSLSSPGWIGQPIELDGPPDTETFRAVVVQQRTRAQWFHPNFPDVPGRGTARVIFQVTHPDRTDLFERRVNAEGTGWDESDWVLLDSPPGIWQLRAAVPVRSTGTVPCYLFLQAANGILWYRVYGDDRYPQWNPFGSNTAQFGSGTFLGAFLWPSGDQVFALWKVGGISTRAWRLLPPRTLPLASLDTFLTPQELAALNQSYTQAELPGVIDLYGFNNWLKRAASCDLNEIITGVLGAIAFGTGNLFELLTLPQSHPSRGSLGDNVYQATANTVLTFFENFLGGHIAGTDPDRLQAWQRADQLVLDNSQPRLNLVACARRLFGNRFGAPQPLSMRALTQAPDTSVPSLASLQPLSADSGMPVPGSPIALAYSHTAEGTVRSTFTVDPAGNQLVATDLTRIAPREAGPLLPIGAAWPGVPEAVRRARTQILYTRHQTGPAANLTYLDEYYYFVPLQLATELQRNGHFVAALDWYRTIYDYSEPPGRNRKIWYALVQEQTLANDFARLQDWLLDPLNPHAVARLRFNSYTRFTVLSLIRCFLAYADDEFTRDTAESLERARTLYLTALELLDVAELRQTPNACDAVIGSIEVRLSDPSWRPVFAEIIADLGRLDDLPALEAAAAEVSVALSGEDPDEVRMARARGVVDDALAARPAGRTFAQVVQARARMHPRAHAAVLAHDGMALAAREASTIAANDQRLVLRPLPDGPGAGSPGDGAGNGARGFTARRLRFVYDPGVVFQFCIPPNPVVLGLRLRAAINLEKLRTCRNIAGVERQVEPYAAATDTTSGLPVVGADGQLTLPGGIALRPTPYRFDALIARAKELVQTAAQIEASLLSAIEKRDQELYNQLKARQDIRLAAAGVRLRELQVREAEGAVALAELHRDRAEFQVQHFEELLDEGYLLLETLSLVLQGTVAAGYATAAVIAALPFSGGSAAQAFGFSVQAIQTLASTLSQWASYERREQEWEFQRDVARFDVRIGVQQVQNAAQHVQVTAQERRISQLQVDHAEQGAEFIVNKFSNAELYDWMSDILEEVYAFFLHQATATAKLALAQLAFERQQVPPAVLRDDYWEVPGEGVGPEGNGVSPDRRGLTGSARLLRDIQELEQFAFDTQQRRLELSRTISLAHLAPFEFARFRESGIITFATPLELFDRDFPGHYLRQVKRVRVSVIALVPPVQGIRATLTSSRVSRVVIGGDLFQTVRVERGPEQIALTSPRDASGLLDLEAHSELLRPFEGIGVDTFWEFRMPKAANPFDFATIADVLVTIDYTALNSFDYRQQVIRALPETVTSDRAFSFRHQFADQWYDLHNPELTSAPMVVRFRTRREDFPPNLDELSIRHVVLYFARKPGLEFEVPVAHLQLTGAGGMTTPPGGAASIGGVISTRRGNAASWLTMIGKSPVGDWELALPDTAEIRRRFKEEELDDLLLVLTYGGRAPAWPA